MLTELGPGGTGHTSGTYMDGRNRKKGMIYVACHAQPGVSRSGSGCAVHDWACSG